jgi:hypothetical protein
MQGVLCTYVFYVGAANFRKAPTYLLIPPRPFSFTKIEHKRKGKPAGDAFMLIRRRSPLWTKRPTQSLHAQIEWP